MIINITITRTIIFNYVNTIDSSVIILIFLQTHFIIDIVIFIIIVVIAIISIIMMISILSIITIISILSIISIISIITIITLISIITFDMIMLMIVFYAIVYNPCYCILSSHSYDIYYAWWLLVHLYHRDYCYSFHIAFVIFFK